MSLIFFPLSAHNYLLIITISKHATYCDVIVKQAFIKNKLTKRCGIFLIYLRVLGEREYSLINLLSLVYTKKSNENTCTKWVYFNKSQSK